MCEMVIEKVNVCELIDMYALVKWHLLYYIVPMKVLYT